MSVWPWWDVLAVWLGWDVLIPGLAGLPGAVSLPVGGSILLGVSARSVISVLHWLVWPGWDVLAVWPGWDVSSVWLWWDVLKPGLAGLPGAVSLPVGEPALPGVSAGSVISVLRWLSVWAGWDVHASVWSGLGVFNVGSWVCSWWDVGRSLGGTSFTLRVLMSG